MTLRKLELQARLNKSAIFIQKLWRAKRARVKYQKDVKRIIQIQAVVRGFLSRRRARAARQMLLQETSAVIVQSQVRCWMQRRKFLRLKTSCTVIQTWLRAVKAGKETRDWLLLEKKSAVIIQS